ncbi:hypothetical protein [Paraburkholderia bannensis]|uniref:hypothetical protein n=1 Tax=Paraburkholderia bannensis TaxID=765414 RepID=UPI0009FC9712|nr:hypothetical protein [Paraburkholderia bannensis]
MESVEMSLRDIVERWLTPRHAVPFRIRALRNASHGRYVEVEARGPGGDIALCFFLHEDGAWRVFPPLPPRRPTMRAA